MGRATISYVVVHDRQEFVTYNSIDAGGQTFTGYVVSASMNQIPEGWWTIKPKDDRENTI